MWVTTAVFFFTTVVYFDFSRTDYSIIDYSSADFSSIDYIDYSIDCRKTIYLQNVLK